MPLGSYFDNLEPPSEDVEIWRFMPLEFFEDLMANEEFHFCRADLFKQDVDEGIPPDDYIRRIMGLRRFILEDEIKLNHEIAELDQSREMYYVSCWHLFRHETVEMWSGFAKDGVAVQSRYALLKSVMAGMPDTTHVGLMRYGEERLHQTGRINGLQFINTKRKAFEHECEVRAIVECGDPFSGGNRHFDLNNFPHRRPLPENPRHHWVHDHKRRRIELASLITGVVVSPWASNGVLEIVKQWVDVKKHSYLVQQSNLRID